MTFAEAIEAEAGQQIIGCVIRNSSGKIKDWDDEPDTRDIPIDKCCVVLPWVEARALLDYEWDEGFGAQDCHDFYAWTESLVLCVHEYDGATYVQSFPRNPVAP
jgi:hypothetical protein